VSSGSVAVHPDSSVQLLAEEATLVENLETKVNKILFVNMYIIYSFDLGFSRCTIRCPTSTRIS